MEAKIDSTISKSDYATLCSIFTTASFTDLSQREQQSLSAKLIKSSMISSNTNFFPAALNHPEMISVLKIALNKIPPSTASFVVENALDNKLRYLLFDWMVKEEGDYRAAAEILAGMRMNETTDESHEDGGISTVTPSDNYNSSSSAAYNISNAERTDVYLKIAECFLEENDSVEAESFVNKAGNYVESIVGDEKNMTLILRYKSTYARILDANRKFLQAALRYHELSRFGSSDGDGGENGGGDANNNKKRASKGVVVNADDLLEFLGRAATCAVLAPGGPQCQRILGLVFKDERLAELDSLPNFQTHSAIVTKMYMNQVIRHNADLIKFEESLSDHQKAIGSDGCTIIEKAVMEHNMVAVSHLYDSIYLVELGDLLGIDKEKAEKMAAEMITNGSLGGGSIDQVEGLLVFEKESRSGGGGSEALVAWDEAITSFCVQLNRVTDAIRA